MINSKVFQLISAFTLKERRQILSLITSEFFFLSAEELSLMKAMINLSNSDWIKTSKEGLFKSHMSKGKYEDQKMRLSLSRIFKALEGYIVFNQSLLKENSRHNNLLLSRYYRKKELNKLYLGCYRSSIKDPGYLENVSFEVQLEESFENYQFNSLQKRNQELNIQNLLDLSDKSFYANKLRYVCYALSHEAIYTIHYEFEHLGEILERIRKERMFENPRIGVYYYCYLMISKPEEEQHYFRYKEYLFKHQQLFDFEEKRSLYFFALNHCIKKLNSGEKEYGKEGLDIYQNGISNETLFINKRLSRYTYRNMAMMAIRIGDFELAEKLTDEFDTYLRREDRESAYHFNKALIYYYKKELDLALENITKADFKDHLINLAAKSLQAKIYYEQKEHLLLESHLDSVEIYLIRKKVLGYHRKNYKNFIKYSKKLVRLNPYYKDQKFRLIEKIQNEEVLTERPWLLEQLMS